MTPRIKKLLAQIRAEVKDLPHDYQNIVAVEQSLESCVSDLKSITATNEVLMSVESLEALYEGLSSYPEAIRNRQWHEAMSILREALQKQA